jgi:cell cycle checkpoint control protein RAD9A
MDEFDDVEVQDKLHIIISVKDFRAILQHAQMTSGALTTSYSNPGRPMKLSYSTDGVLCEFILMTVGEKDALTQKHRNPRASAAKAAATQLDAASHRGSSVGNDNQPNPPPTASRQPQKTPIRPRQPAFEIRPSPMPPPTTARSDSLFVDQAEDDEQWEPVNPDEEEVEENGRLEWNATNEPVPFLPCRCLRALLTRGRTRRLCALGATCQNKPRLQRGFPTAWPRDLSRLNDSPRCVLHPVSLWVSLLTGAGPPFRVVFSMTQQVPSNTLLVCVA